jgi:hypothetical protein
LNWKLKWDFCYDTWELFKNKVEGGYMQQGMSYTFNMTFLTSYMDLGDQVILDPDFTHLALMVPQIKIDHKALYGTLKVACVGGGSGSQYLIAHEATLDGFKVWYAFVKEYDDQGCTDVADMKWEAILQTRYMPNYRGRLLGFIQDYENAFMHLNKHHRVLFWDDEKMQKLWLNLMYDETKDMVAHIWDMSFAAACQ